MSLIKWIASFWEKTENPVKVDEPIQGELLRKTDSSCRDYQQDVWKNIDFPASTLISGYKFGATMQLRTPLRVLLRHGENHIGLIDPPAIATEEWEGGWSPLLKSNKELDIDFPEVVMTNASMASDIGPIPSDGGEYLKFLMNVRVIVEAETSIEVRRTALREELRKQEWQDFCIKLGGNQNISNQLFPPFIQTIKGLPSDAIAAMWEAGLYSPTQLDSATDAALKAFKGIGPAKLSLIRAACFAANDKMSEFSDNVCR